MPMLNNLSRQYLGPEYGVNRTSTERVTMDQVDAVSLLTVNLEQIPVIFVQCQ